VQVEQPIQTSGNKQAAAMNLNQFPEGATPFTFDVNSAPVETLRGWPRSCTRGPIQPLFGWPKSSCTLARETMKPKESEPTPNDMSSAPAAVEPFQILIAKAPASSAKAASDSMPACVPAPEAIPVPNSVPTPDPLSASAPAPAPVSTHVSEAVPPTVPLPEEIVNHLEEKMMSELEVLGFLQADLNKQVLRQNNYDLEQSVVDLCGFNEWHPLHEDISDLVSMNTL